MSKRAPSRLIKVSALVTIILLLTALPQSPYLVIKGIKKKSGLVELSIPANKLSESLSVNNCSDQDISSAYNNAESFNMAKSGINVFKSRLAKEFKNSNNFTGLALKTLSSSESLDTQTQTCLLPLKISVNPELAADPKDLLNVSLGSESIFCSKGKAYLNDNSGFFAVDKALADYASQIKQKKAVITLTKQLTDLQKQKAASSKKSEKEKLEKKIKKLSLAISYAKYFTKDAALLSQFFDAVCAQAGLILTPNNKPNTPKPTVNPTAVPTKTSTPAATNTAIWTATRTATPTNTVTDGTLTAPVITSPAAGTVEAVNNTVTIRWNPVANATGYRIGAVNKTANLDILFEPEYSATSYNLNVSAGITYRFWVRARNATTTAENPAPLSEVIFTVEGVPVDNCNGSNSQSCTIANGTGAQSRTCNAGSWSSWGNCLPVSCNSGYVSNGSACIPETGTYTLGKYKFDYQLASGIYQSYIGTSWTGGGFDRDQLYYDFMVDGYGGMGPGHCLQRSKFITNPAEKANCAKLENSDLFRADAARNVLIKNATLKNAFVTECAIGGAGNNIQRAEEGHHTDTFQSYGGTQGKNGWLAIQDTVIKNSDHGLMIVGDTFWKGFLYQNLTNTCEQWFKSDATQRALNDRNNYPGSVIGGIYPCGNQIGAHSWYLDPVTGMGATTWLINSASDFSNISINTPHASYHNPGPVIVIGNVVSVVSHRFENGKWGAIVPHPKVYRYSYIEDAVSAGHQLPPYADLSCSGWRNPPAGCTSGRGYSKE